LYLPPIICPFFRWRTWPNIVLVGDNEPRSTASDAPHLLQKWESSETIA
jgi:hypothetical protein